LKNLVKIPQTHTYPSLKKIKIKPVILQLTFLSSIAIMGIYTETKGKVTLIYKFIKIPGEKAVVN